MYSYDSAKCDVIFNQFTDKGFYVDIGVRDGVHDNKTFLLYLNDWSGIVVDAHPDYINICKQFRPNDTVLSLICGKDDDSCTFRYNWRGSFGAIFNKELDERRAKYHNKWYGKINNSDNYFGFKNKIEKNISKSLNTILDTYNPENKDIDILSIDVDGSEQIVLENFNILKYNPKIVCIELEQNIHGVGIQQHKFIIDYMKKNNYIFIQTLDEDAIWANNKENYNKIKKIIKNTRSFQINNTSTIHPVSFCSKRNLILNKDSILKYRDYIYEQMNEDDKNKLININKT